MARKPTIYPEVVRPGDWLIEEWRPDGTGAPCPCTDNEGRKMYVPGGNSEFAREVRFHELLHVKYSPPGVPEIEGVTQGSLLASEDCRVNLLGALIRPHDALGTMPSPDPFLLLTTKTELDLARLTAASLGYTSSDDWIEEAQGALDGFSRLAALPSWLRKHARTLRDAMSTVRDYAAEQLGDLSSFDGTVDLARWLDDNFSDKPPGPKRSGPKADDPEPNYDEEADGEGGTASKARWGEMKIVEPPLVHSHASAIGRRTTASAKGARIRHMNRMVSGEIFGRTRKRAVPDVVLVDNSGSMGWDTSKLHEIVRQLPVGIVASYDGANGVGELKILARDGRMVAAAQVEAQYGGNEVDGPALRWLAKQHGRKLWVSDQGVCSDVCDDESHLKADCDAIVKAAGIRVCLTTDPKAIMRALKGK